MIILYILLGLLGLLVVLAVSGMIFFKLAVGRRDSWHAPDEKVIGSGPRRALLLYQPSNGGHNVPLVAALARLVADKGYTVTVNYPSERLDYNLADYDLLLFGSGAYLGETSKALRNYLQARPVTGKDVFLFVTGAAKEAPELEALKLLLPDENTIQGIKVDVKEKDRLLDFAEKNIS